MPIEKPDLGKRCDREAIGVLLIATLFSAGLCEGAASPVSISQVPLTVAIPAHPQVLFAIANSESMDGTLAGAIMTGSGSLGPSLAQLNASTSPVQFAIPTSFTPPIDPGDGVNAPYTVNVGGTRYDNSASRLNVAKAGISTILQTFLANADFAMIDYKTSGLNAFTTWVYLMSPNGATPATSGFQFTNTPGATDRFVANPCFGVNVAAGDPVSRNCAALDAYYNAQNITTQADLIIGANSDDPQISDVLYAGGLDPVFVNYSSDRFGNPSPPSPPSPFPPNYSLAQFNGGVGNINESYNNSVNCCALTTNPTNAGFVGSSQEIMYVERGFGYYTFGETSDDGRLLVSMTSAGAVPTTASVNAALARFSPLLAPETDNSGSGELKSAATQSPLAGLLKGSKKYLSGTIPSSNGCAAQKYVVLVTDGLPTLDINGGSWPPLGSAAAVGYGVSATFNSDGTVAATNDQALVDTIAQLTALQAAGIKTYVIGLGAGVSRTVNPVAADTLTAMAVAGGTGSFFPANSPAALVNDMQVILSQILAATQSVASAAVNSTGLHNGSLAYQAQFTTADSNQDWTGGLSAFPINPADGTVDTTGVPTWSAQALLDAQSWDARLIATWDPVANAGTPFRWNSGASPTGISTATALGTQLMTFPGDTSGQDVLQFLRGNNAKEIRFGGAFRNRTHKLGDIVDSSPVYVGAPSGASQSSGYVSYAQANVTRLPMIYVGANDGMLHAFEANTGVERFTYIPKGVYANLIKLVNPYYNAQHQFYVNGSPQAADVRFSDASWHTVLVSGLNAGGKDVFALDVTAPAAITTESLLASKVLWDFTDANMGLSYSTPAIAATSAGYVVFFGNGYNSPTQTPFLYALNPADGTVLTKIDLCGAVTTACNTGLPNGLSSVTVTNSSGNLSGNADVVYAGDLQGNVWRINISSTTPSTWTTSLLFQARDADSSGSPQPITTPPAVTLNPKFPHVHGTLVVAGTGQMLGIPDLGSTQVQSIYGIFDNGLAGATITRTNLVAQTLAIDTLHAGFRTVSSNPVPIPTKKGWKVDFNLLTGERVVTDPLIDSGAVIATTNQPSSNSCAGGENSYLNEFNFSTGGSFTQAQFDTSGDHKITIGDSIEASMSLGTVYSASPRVRSGNFTGGTRVKLITESSGAIQSVTERGPQQQRTAWWEIR